jgi:hypothetical protein
MSAKAIYTIHEKGKDFHFFSEYAGGFSYPFAAADFLHSLKYVLDSAMSPQKNLCVSPLLEQMKGDCRFSEEAEGRYVFCAVEEGKALALASEQEVPFMVEIDMEQDTVSFCFDEECKELQDYCDITLQRLGEPGEFGGARFRAAAENLMCSNMVEGGNRVVSDINEEAYGKMILKAVRMQTERRIQPADVNEGERWRKKK